MTMNTEDRAETRGGGNERIKEAAEGVAHEAGRAAETKASQTMTQLGDTLEQVARAVRDAGEGMRGERPEIAGVADTAADKVERASDYLREHDAREALDAAQDFARRQPLAVAAGGLALGLVVGRVLRTAGAGSPGTSRTHGRYDRRQSSGADRYGESYAGGTYGGSSFGASAYDVAGSPTGAAYADTPGGVPGASTIVSGEPIEPGGAIDTGRSATLDEER